MENHVDASATSPSSSLYFTLPFAFSSAAETMTLHSLRCKPTLSSLPPELLSNIGFNLTLNDYSFLSRTCSRLHKLLCHPAELVLFLKTRYRLSIESGSIIVFAYLANMQVTAPRLLERIFDDFFADSMLHRQDEQHWRLQQKQQNQAITNDLNGADHDSLNNTNMVIQRLNSIDAHKAAEKTKGQAKWEAVRMLGVLYALDKTYAGPSSSSNALVLSGACSGGEHPLSAGVIDSEPVQRSSSIAPSQSAAFEPSAPSLIASSSVSSPRDTRRIPVMSHVGERKRHPSAQSQHRHQSQRPFHGRWTRRAASQERPDTFRICIQKRASLKKLLPTIVTRDKPKCAMANGRYDPEMVYSTDEDHRALLSNVSSFAETDIPSTSSVFARSCASASSSQTTFQERTRGPLSSPRMEPQRIMEHQGDQRLYGDRYNEERAHLRMEREGLHQLTFQQGLQAMKDEDTFMDNESSSVDMDWWLHDWETRSAPTLDSEDRDQAVMDIFGEQSLQSIPIHLESDKRRDSFPSTHKNDSTHWINGTAPLIQTEGNSGCDSSGSVSQPRNAPPRTTGHSSSTITTSPTTPAVASAFSSMQPTSVPLARASLDDSVSDNSMTEMQDLQRRQSTPRLSDKIAFLTKYTDRMHRKLETLGIKDWGQGDIQRKKTYQLMIQHNDKTGEKDLVQFYLGRYGGSSIASDSSPIQAMTPQH
ncbi:hypothetical protein BGZ51_000748 [Haplosporangium sp. Z 767]|nr:hypothetical protein BGZ51_000748 [Haplosporangium sp. Z 767]KAF9193421.1 hypothetical protein BGZ50_007493 [Haplosporangium sp. Z 11]